eukprot:CAMPEP_0118876948 /NCGR_PEP_ID=MMETSP1163-20130328/17435_1 /TAXON_ID=124430 /ORGANISM="Phaeomonas parva, Strain CCMP2877" /LENGTH=314 /DNA_ID=CAMNT_0006812609 /DNA_START=86 /DNA_END=1030 /DNA_ORIENTATION=-
MKSASACVLALTLALGQSYVPAPRPQLRRSNVLRRWASDPSSAGSPLPPPSSSVEVEAEAPAEVEAEAPAAPAAAVPAGFDDVSGDGGVLRKVTTPGSGDALVDRDIAIVDYEGFEYPSGRKLFAGSDLSIVVGDGSMIKGWDVGLTGMAPGSAAEVILAPEYAYGATGVAPVLSGAASLKFALTVKEKKGNSQAVRIFTDMDPLLPRTPESIRASYTQRQEERRLELEETLGDSMTDKVKRWLGSLYIFGFFSEGAPWYLNPLITFPSILVVVAASSFLLYGSGAVTLERTSTAVPAIETIRKSSTIDDIEDD